MDKGLKYITEQSLEFKISYINALSFFINLNLNKENEKRMKEYLIEYIDFLEIGTMKEDLLEFLEEPDNDEIDETLETINDYDIVYIADIFFLILIQEKITEDAEKYVNLVKNKFGLLDSTNTLIVNFIISILSKEKFQTRELSAEIVKDKKLTEELSIFTTMNYFPNPKAEVLKQEIVRKFECYDFKTFSEDDIFEKNFSEVDDIVKDDIDFIIELSNYSDLVFKYFTTEISRSDKELVIELVKYYGDFLRFTTDELKNDKEVVLEAIKQDGTALCYANENFKNDKDIVLEAVKQRGSALRYASENLQNDKEVILEAVKQNGWALNDLNDNFKNDKDIVLEAVKQAGYALNYANDNLKNDKKIVLEAVKQDGQALQYAEKYLQDDKEVVLEAVKQSGSALSYASENLRNNPDFILKAVKQSGRSLSYVSENLKDDKNTVLIAVKQDGEALSYASENLQDDREVVLEAIKQNSWALSYASENLRDDKELALISAKKRGEILRRVSKNLQNDYDVVMEAIKQYPYAINYASDELKNSMDLTIVTLLHPLREESSKIKSLYLDTVSFFVNQEKSKTTEDKFLLLSNSLSVKADIKSDEEIKSNYEDLKNLFENREHLDALCLMDILYILDNLQLEDDLLERIRVFFEISKYDFEVIYNFVLLIKQGSTKQIEDTMETIVKSTNLVLKAKYTVGFYKIDFRLRNNLSEQYSKLEKKANKEQDRLWKINSDASWDCIHRTNELTSKAFRAGEYEAKRLLNEADELEKEDKRREAEYKKKNKELEYEEKYYASLVECFNNNLELIKQ